jgi:imidazole glycerol-phosphate synthase subunit HisH
VIAIVDSGRSNLLSVSNAFDYLGAKTKICADGDGLEDAERLVVPGIGAFRDGMRALKDRGFPPVLDSLRAAGMPILGICLGMQFFAERSFEGGETPGLGWFDAEVVRLDPNGLRVPHMGWNRTMPRDTSPLFAGLPAGPDFYYVHSYHVRCTDPDDVEAVCDYGGSITSAIRKGNVAAVQFHPEKSQDHGLQVLENFIRWNP